MGAGKHVRVLGIDPGLPSKTGGTGWAVVDVMPDITGVYVDGGVIRVDVDPHHITRLITDNDVALVAIERPRAAGSGALLLIDTALVAGQILGWSRIASSHTSTCTSWDWKRVLTGHPSAKDAEVKHALSGCVEGLPARTNCHVRDAVGVALWGGREKASTMGPAAMVEL